MSNTNPTLIILGAIIAGLFSLVTLIFTKELKISEARLNWNHEIRSELAKLLGAMESIYRLVEQKIKLKSISYNADQVENHNNTASQSTGLSDVELMKFRKENKEIYAEMNRAYYHALLYIDPDYEKGNGVYKRLSDKLKEVRSEFWGPCRNLENINKLYEEMTGLSIEILTTNWEMVRKGEPAFYRIKFCLMLIIGVAMALGLSWIMVSIVGVLDQIYIVSCPENSSIIDSECTHKRLFESAELTKLLNSVRMKISGST